MRPNDELEWITRPHEPGEPARHVAELSERGHEETFVVLVGTLSIYLGDPPKRVDVPAGGVVHVEPGTPLQSANHGDADLLVYAYGAPAEHERAELLDSAL